MSGSIEITPPRAIPNLERLLEAVRAESPLHESYIHGEQHWRAVAEVGLRLAQEKPRADRDVVFLFSVFHDAKRTTEELDAGHGERAAELAERLHGRLYRLPDQRLEFLLAACRQHSDARFTDHPTLGVCFDADRLNLWRVGRAPEDRLLSTDAALDEELQRWSMSLHGRARSWEELLRAYAE
jgi:uncharacterized protein